MTRRARISELLLRLAVADRDAYEGLLGDLHEETARADRPASSPMSPNATHTAGGCEHPASHTPHGGARRTRATSAAGSAYGRAVLSLAFSYLADRARRLRRRDRPMSRGSRRPQPWGPLRGLREDFRQAGRLVRRRAGFSSAVIVTLALGFGAAAAVLSVAYGVWLKPLPFRDPDALVRLYEVRLAGDQGSIAGDAAIRPSALDAEVARRSALSPPLVEDLRATRWSSLTGVAAVSGRNYEWQHDDGTREQVAAVLASRGAFEVLGLQPLAGRAFGNQPGSREVVASEAFWRRALGGDPAAVGRTSLRLDGEAYRLVGVVADGLPYPDPGGDLWAPLDFSADELGEGMRGARYLDVVGRLHPGELPAAAAGELDAFVQALGADHPNHTGWGATAVPLRADLIRPYLDILLMLVAGAGLFLLISCSNVAGLVAARRVKDRSERGLRLALGASRGRVLRQEMAEMLLLGGAAALGAALLARWTLTPLRRLAPADIPRIADIRLDPVVMAALGGLVLAAGALIALVGHALAGNVRPGRIASRGATAVGTRGRSLLMVGQVALTTILLLGGAVLAGHFIGLANVDTGFDADGVVVGQVLMNGTAYQERARRLQLIDALTESLRQRGHAVAFGINPPIAGARMRFGFRADADPESEQFWGQYHVVSPGYFEMLRIPLRSGRDFTAADRAGTTPVVIISEALARAHFEGDPVGREMIVVGTVREIVGVVGAVRHFGPDGEPPAELYVPLGQDPWLLGHFLVRPGESYSPDDLRAAVAAIDPAVLAPALTPYGDFVRTWFAPLRFQLTVVGLLSIAATALAIFGLYALVAYVVAGRTREIGIRVALGETSRSVFARVVVRGLLLAVSGVALGVAVAMAFRGLLLSLIDGVEANDPLPLLVVILVVLAAACVATAWPARRAAAVDPVEALRRS